MYWCGDLKSKKQAEGLNCKPVLEFLDCIDRGKGKVKIQYMIRSKKNVLMKKITAQDFKELSTDADILASDKYGVKVMQTVDGKIIKLYRRKKMLSSALFYPYALRFLRNSLLLKKLGFITVTVDAVYNIPDIKRSIVIYQKLDGTVLREALLTVPDQGARIKLLEDFAAFAALLHDKGILFRSIHFGNVLVLSTGDFALIDLADLRYQRFGSLLPWQRLRNFRHMCRYSQDVKFLVELGAHRFIDIYLENSRLKGITRWLSKILALRYFGRKLLI